MKAFFASFVAVLLCLAFGTSVSAQTRSLGAHQLVLDDGAGNTITIQTPSSGWTGNIPFRLAIPPAGNPLAGFVNAGTVANQILYWNTTNNDWEAESVAALGGITGTGTNGTIPLWTGTSTQGNSALTDDGTTLSYGHAHINSTTDYQIGATTILASAGTDDISVGAGAGNAGLQNTFVGVQAGQSTSTGASNTLIGMQAGQSTTANGNTMVGTQAGKNTGNASSNTFIGLFSGISNTTGSDNTEVGEQTNVGSPNLTNATAIGANAVVNASNEIQLGFTDVTLVNTSGAYNTATGYQVSGAAASGNYLRGNGTNFVSSALSGADLSNSSVTVAKISATGTAGSTTFLRGDGSWATPSAPNTISIGASPSSPVTNAGTISGSSTVFWVADGATINLPAASTAGQHLVILDVNPAGTGVTVQRQGSDLIYDETNASNGVTSDGAFFNFEFVSDGNGHWYQYSF
jgi:hypothetical protein